MSKIDTVPIHHDDLDVEAWVPPEALVHHVALGWAEGRLERLELADAEAAAKDAEQAALAAEEWAKRYPNAEQIAANEAEAAARLLAQQADTAAAEEIAAPDPEPAPEPIASRRGQPATSEEAPAGDNSPMNPEEGQP